MTLEWTSPSTFVEHWFVIFDTAPNALFAFPVKFQSLTDHLEGVTLLAGVVQRSNAEDMLRISTFDTPKERRLIVEGALINPWVAELRRTSGAAGAALEGRCLVIDLTNATTIDREGEAAIFELMQEGAKFCCSGVLTKHVLKQLAGKCHTELSNVLHHQRERSKEEG